MSADGPLAGLRILDTSQYLPGPYASLLLADLGADVLGVEPPAGDPGRHVNPQERGDSALHAWVGRGKRSTVLDLKTPDGVAKFLSWLAARTWCWKGSGPAWKTGSEWDGTPVAPRTRPSCTAASLLRESAHHFQRSARARHQLRCPSRNPRPGA